MSQAIYGHGLWETTASQERNPPTANSAQGAVRQAILSIVRRSSLRQACLGIASGAGFRGFSYILAKAQKRWRSHRV